jgi:hydrogenase maturation protease
VNVLVAGIGNLFLGDDGFGPEVVRRLAGDGPPPAGVTVVDYGIRGMHLAYDLLDGYDLLVLVDALPGGGTAGEVAVLEVGPGDVAPAELDAHGMNPAAVLGGLSRLGGTLPPTYVVGCRVQTVSEGIGLSPAVAAAVPEAITQIRALLTRVLAPTPAGSAPESGPTGSASEPAPAGSAPEPAPTGRS